MAFQQRVLPWLILFFCSPSLSAGLILHGYSPRPASTTARPHRNNTQLALRRGPISTELSTCGYLNGDPALSRTANSGYNCRVDTANGLWGFCPTTVISATDCGLAGSCVDAHSCSTGCGFIGKTKLTTFTCSPKQYCSTALLTFGVDQTYSYIACGGGPSTDHYLISPTAQATPTTNPTTEPTVSTTPATSRTSSAPSATSAASLTTSSSTGLPPTSTGLAAPETEPGSPAYHDQSNNQPNNIGAIIGGVIGGLALLCGSAIAIIYLLRRHRAAPVVDARQNNRSELAADSGVYAKPNSPDRNRWMPQELPASPRAIPRLVELPS